LFSASSNTYSSRSHLLDLTGYNWIRFNTSAGGAFLGDSITASGMNHLEGGDLNFAQRINATLASDFPMYENAGQPFDTATGNGMTRLRVLLANSQAKYIGISYGTNDGASNPAIDYTFYNAYKAMVDLVLASGRIPVIPTIPWTAQQPWQSNIGDPITGPQFGLNKQLAKLKADYRAQGQNVVDGPDLWTFFKNNPTLIGSGDIHPTPAGYVAMRNQWAAAAIANIYTDRTPPSVPASLTAVAVSLSRIDLSWAASSDDVGVTGYVVFRNGVQIASVTSGTTYSDTALLPNTSYSYAVAAYDAANNRSAPSAPVVATTLADTTAPTVAITAPAPNTTIAGVVTVTASASDNVAVAGVTFRADGVNIAPEVTSPPYSVSFNASTLTAGAHLLTAVARDTANQTTVSAAVSVNVADTLPPTAPSNLQASNVTVSSVTLSWSASTDNVGVSGYNLRRNGLLIHSGSQTSYTDAGLLNSTTYSYAVEAFDVAGNVSGAATISATTAAPVVTMAPMPIISRNVPAFASSEQTPASMANDTDYTTEWRSTGQPAWIVYDLSGVAASRRQQTVVAWHTHSGGSYDYAAASVAAANAPGPYVIEGNPAPGGGLPPTSGWVTLATSPSPQNYANNQHYIPNFGGNNWMRFRTLGPNPVNSPGSADVSLNLDVHDAHLGPLDTWIFFGDSITQTVWDAGQYSQIVAAGNSQFFPAATNGGVPLLSTTDALALFPRWLPLFAGKYVGIAFGTNDAGQMTPSQFYANEKALVDLVLAAGKIPVIPSVPWATAAQRNDADIRALNGQIAQLKADYAGRIVDGPDLYAAFLNRVDLLADGLLPNANGAAVYRQAWADQMLRIVYAPATPPTVPAGLTAGLVSSSEIDLTWTASTDNVGVSGYHIYRNGTLVGTSSLPSFSDTSVAPSTAYVYTVSAYDGDGNESERSTPLGVATP
jgi:lysophospholipase L1-like esterase/chitodextrinase